MAQHHWTFSWYKFGWQLRWPRIRTALVSGSLEVAPPRLQRRRQNGGQSLCTRRTSETTIKKHLQFHLCVCAKSSGRVIQAFLVSPFRFWCALCLTWQSHNSRWWLTKARKVCCTIGLNMTRPENKRELYDIYAGMQCLFVCPYMINILVGKANLCVELSSELPTICFKLFSTFPSEHKA